MFSGFVMSKHLNKHVSVEHIFTSQNIVVTNTCAGEDSVMSDQMMYLKFLKVKP